MGLHLSYGQKSSDEWPFVGFRSANVDRDYSGANISLYLTFPSVGNGKLTESMKLSEKIKHNLLQLDVSLYCTQITLEFEGIL